MRRFEECLIAEGIATSSRAAYVDDVRRFWRWIRPRGHTLVTVRTADVVAYRDDALARRRSAASVRRALMALRRFYRYMLTQKAVPSSPVEGVRCPRPALALAPRAIPWGQVERLRAVARTTGCGRDRMRNETLVTLLGHTGLRLSELLALRWGDVDLEHGFVRVPLVKSLAARDVPLTSMALRQLRRWRRWRRATARAAIAPIICGPHGEPLSARAVQHLVGRLGRAAGIDISPHALRRTFATAYLAHHPGDLAGLAALLGHRSIATTAVYLLPSRDDLAAKVEALARGPEWRRTRNGGD